MVGRPKRQRKGDRISAPGATAGQIECDYALAPFDEAARAAERKWGIDRLPALASPETAQKFGRCIGRLNEAIEKEDAELVAHISKVAIRGLQAMEKEATENGAQPINPKFCQCEFEGKIFTVVQDVADMEKYTKAENEAVFTMREFAAVMKSMKLDGGLLEMVKDHFPGAQIVQFKSKLNDKFWGSGGDPIPF